MARSFATWQLDAASRCSGTLGCSAFSPITQSGGFVFRWVTYKDQGKQTTNVLLLSLDASWLTEKISRFAKAALIRPVVSTVNSGTLTE